MKNEFLQQKLGELIYILGERDFNVIKPETWQLHINENKDFSDKQIQIFKDYLTELIKEANELAEAEQKDEFNSKVDKAILILKEHGLKKIHVCDFGIFHQYELAGEEISINPIEWLGKEAEDILGDKYDEVHEQLEQLLGWIDEDYIYSVLGYDREGQNRLYITQKGFKTKTFSI